MNFKKDSGLLPSRAWLKCCEFLGYFMINDTWNWVIFNTCWLHNDKECQTLFGFAEQ